MLYLIGMWLGEDQRTNTIKDTYLKEFGLRSQFVLTTPHSIVNTIERTYAFDQGITKHALLQALTI